MTLHLPNLTITCSHYGCLFKSHDSNGYTDQLMGWFDISIRLLAVLVVGAIVFFLTRLVARRRLAAQRVADNPKR